MHLWGWLGDNSEALVALFAIVSAVLTAVTIGVLIGTWIAIHQQANEARALTRVALEQTKAAENAASAAKQQAELLESQLEINTAPLIVAEPINEPIIQYRRYKLFNRGAGTAFQVLYWQGGLEARNQNQGQIPIVPIQPSTIAPNLSVPVNIPVGWECFTVRYKGIDRQERWTVVYADAGKPQQHIVRKGLQEIYIA